MEFGQIGRGLGAGAEGIDHEFAIIAFGEQHGSDLGIGEAQPAQQTQIGQVIPRIKITSA